MNLRHLWIRSTQQHAILRVRTEIEQAIRDFFYDREFVLIDSPILTGPSVEGTSTLFETDYFGDKAYLSQSGQLYLEPAAAAFGKVYCFGPDLPRREVEDAAAPHRVLDGRAGGRLSRVRGPLSSWPRTSSCRSSSGCWTAAAEDLKRLERDTSKLEPSRSPSRASPTARRSRSSQEKGIAGQLRRRPRRRTRRRRSSANFDRPLIVSRFPTAIKSFYMQPDPDDPEVVLGLDMLAPEGYGEIIGGSQRIHDHDLLEQRLDEHKLPREAFEWYLDVRRYGTFPHSGLRHGYRALRGVGVRHPPPARDDPVSADTEADLSVSAPPRPSASSRSGAPKNLVDTEVMLGHLAAGRARHRPGRGGARRDRQHVRLHRPGQGGVRRGDPRAGRAQEAGRDRPRRSWPGCMVQKYGRELAAEMPEVDAFVGSRRARECAGRGRGAPDACRGSPTSRWRRGSTTSGRRGCSRAGAATRTSRSGRAATIPARSARFPRCAGTSAAARSRRCWPRPGRSRRRESPSWS